MNDADVALVRRAAEMMGYKYIIVHDGFVWVADPEKRPYTFETAPFNPLANDHDTLDFWRWAAQQKSQNIGFERLARWSIRVRSWGNDYVFVEIRDTVTKDQDARGHSTSGDLNRAIVEAIVQAGQGGKG